MKTELTQSQLDEYISDPNFCPWCGNMDIEYSIGGVKSCPDCEKRWVDIVTVNGVEEYDGE